MQLNAIYVAARTKPLVPGDPVHANWHGTWYPGHVLEVRHGGVMDRSLSQLGDFCPFGGTKAHQKARFDILDRIRSVSKLTPPQANIWQLFKEEWDERRRKGVGIRWGSVFAEEMKQILSDLQNGSVDAFSVWMENERKRILPDAECLMLPGITFA